MSTTPTVTVVATDVTEYIASRSLRWALNTLDFTLVDPITVPALGDAVTVDLPAWAGTVSNVVTKSDARGQILWARVTAKNADEAEASAAPWGLSDSPSPPTTYPYRNLEVTRTRQTSGDELRATCETLTEGLFPGMTVELTSALEGLSADEFTIVEMEVGWERQDAAVYKLSLGDPIVKLSTWVDAQAQSAVLPIDSTKITDGAVTTPKLAANAVTAGKIAAGEVTAEKLAATLLLASLIRTAESGVRVEIDEAGIRAFDADDNMLVNIPTDGSPVYVNAEVQASSLVVAGNAAFRGDNDIAVGATIRLQDSYVDPISEPTLTQDWEPFTLEAPWPLTELVYSAAGGSGGATKVFYVLEYVSGTHYLVELLASDGSLNRTKNLGTASATSVAAHGSYIYVTRGSTGIVERYLVSTLALDATYSTVDLPIDETGTHRAAIASDGTDIYIAQVHATTGVLSWNKYNATMVKQGSTIDTTYDVGAPKYLVSIAVGTFDYGAWRLVAAGRFGASEVHVFNAAGAHQTADCFPVPSTANTQTRGITYGDAAGDGARFWSWTWGWGAVTSSAFQITKHTTWTWGAGTSSTLWVAYTWYDSAGTTHESQVSPAASTTMGKRKRLRVTTASLPGGGGADEPNDRRVYALHAATDPGATGFKLQAATGGYESIYLVTYNAAGAADPSSNNFSTGGNPGLISAVGGQWAFWGDGRGWAPRGTSFPTGPTMNDRFHRLDLGLDFVYDGTRWLSVQLFTAVVPPWMVLAPFTGTQYVALGPIPWDGTPHSIWVVGLTTMWEISAGTNSAGNAWSLQFAADVIGNVGSAVSTVGSGNSPGWSHQAVGLAINPSATKARWYVFATKSGSAGNLTSAGLVVHYRLVAT